MKIIKYSLLPVILVFFFFVSFGQTKADWKEMKDFHAVMSKTFHPAEEKNFQPLKDNADSLVIKAAAWQSSKVPVGYNASITAPLLEKLLKQTKTVQQTVVKKKSDEILLKEITKAHDIFHEITEKCRDGE